jgi:rifampin ADP-ribosyltransferase
MTYAKDATPPFYHGTRADLHVGDLLAPGFASNYQEQTLSWIYFTGTLDAAIWGCELARGDGPERIYVVEPTGAFEDDPNLTDKRFPGNPQILPLPRAAQDRRRGQEMGAPPGRTPQGDEGRPRADGSRRRYEDHRLGRARNSRQSSYKRQTA